MVPKFTEAELQHLTRLEQIRCSLQCLGWDCDNILSDPIDHNLAPEDQTIPTFAVSFPKHALSGEQWSATVISFAPLNEDTIAVTIGVEYENGHFATADGYSSDTPDTELATRQIHEFLLRKSDWLDSKVVGDVLTAQFLEHVKDTES